MKKGEKYIFGCYVSGPAVVYDSSINEFELNEATKNNNLLTDKFGTYIWGDNGISIEFKKTDYHNYGEDMKFILFQFYLNPIEYLLKNLKPMESYRKKEKAIGIPIIIWMDDFLKLTDKAKYLFFQKIFMEKMDLLEVKVKRNKLDTNMPKLRADLDAILNYHIQNALD